MNDGMPLLARDVTKVFRGPFGRHRVEALDGLSVAIEPGSVWGLVGPNGSGKTTAIRCCIGLLTRTRGEALLFGAPAGSAAAKTRVGYAPERFDLARKRTGRETLELLGALAGIRGRDLHRRAAALLERFELTAAANRPLGAYSKGMIRRLSVATALLSDPGLLILDEPFDGLDPLGCQAVRDEVERRAHQGTAVLLSSHALADLEEVATHLLVLSAGRTLEQGLRSEVLTVAGRTELLVDGVAPADLAALCHAIEEQGGRVRAARPARESLTDLFRRRLGGGRE